MVLSVEYASDSCWTEVCKKVKNAIVFLDECSAECLHWNGGLGRLLKAGALGVRDFSSSVSGSSQQKKAVFLIKNPLTGPPRMILKDIISSSNFEHCIVITSCSPIALNLATTGNVPEGTHELTALHKLERDILHWMKSEDYTAEIFHFPYGFISVTEYFFVVPAFSDLFPCFEDDLGSKSIQNYGTAEWTMESLPLELQVISVYLMTTLNALLSQLNVREDIYCLGPYSTLIGSQLQKQSTSILRSKTANSTMGLMLIDRNLDVCSCSALENYSFLDCMKSVLPPFPSHSIDVAIDMSSLCSSKVNNKFHVIAPGCLHEPNTEMLEWLIYKTPNDILKALTKEVSTICNLREKASVSPSELEDIVLKKFSGKYDLIKKYSAALQYTLGFTQTVKSSALEKMKLAGSFQKLLMQALAADNKTDEAVKLIINIIETRRNKGLAMEHILLILIFFYNFIGDKYLMSNDVENSLLLSFEKAFSEDKEKYGCNMGLSVGEISVTEFCSRVFKKLNSLKRCRNRLVKFRNIAFYEDMLLPLEYRSVLKQLLEDITNPNKPELEDVKHKPNLSLRDNFASRFSMILSSSRPHIMDNDNVLIFVIGGITGMEVKFIKDYFKPFDKTVIIGSTALTSPAHLIKNIFINDPLKPILI